MEKILFLDVDGVLNSSESLAKKKNEEVIGLDPYMCFLVGKICADTGAQVVLSSSWRGYTEGEAEIRKRCADFIDRTPRLDRGPRGNEIAAWLRAHPEVKQYAILDDDSDMLPEQMPNFFQTNFAQGLTKEIADKVITHLK